MSLKHLYACPHTEVVTEHGMSSCIMCGMEITKVSNDWTDDLQDIKNIDNQQYCVRKIKQRAIYDDIQYLNISQHIKDIANDIYLSVCENTRRGVTRKGIIFGCIFHAYKIDKNPQTHERLIELFKIKKKDALNGLKFIHKNAPKDSQTRNFYINVEDIIIDYMTKFGASSENKTHVLNLYEKIKNTTNILNRSRPQSVSSGLIYYYMTEILNKQINIKDYILIVGLSELTIRKICKEIARVLAILKLTDAIKNDDINTVKMIYNNDITYIYKKIMILNEDMNIEKYINITPLDFSIEHNSTNCIDFFQQLIN